MTTATLITTVVSVIALVYIITLYNGLVTLKHQCKKTLANIDVLLKQRHDELPKLVEVCKRYMDFEQATLTQIIEARSRAVQAQESHNIGDMAKAEDAIATGLGQLFALAENYPNLKADKAFQELQSRISELEGDIADRREMYNEAVNNNNVRVKQLPDAIIAALFRFEMFEHLRFKKSELKDVSIKQLFDA